MLFAKGQQHISALNEIGWIIESENGERYRGREREREKRERVRDTVEINPYKL